MYNVILNQAILLSSLLSLALIVAFSMSYTKATGSTRGNRKTRIVEIDGTFYIQVRYLWRWYFCKKHHPEWTMNWKFNNIQDAALWQQEYYLPVVYNVHNTSVII